MATVSGKASSGNSSDDSTGNSPTKRNAPPAQKEPTSDDAPFYLDRKDLVKKLESLKAGQIFHKKYTMKAVSVPGKLLIRFASQQDGEPESVALKFYTSEELFINSVDIHSQITDARCVCKLVETVDCGSGFPPCNIFPVGQHTLQNWLKVNNPSPTDRRWCLHQILTAIDELHGYYIVHCDLKPTNIMFFEEDTRWKLMDFDSARMVDADMHGAFTVAYAPPEVIFLDPNEESQKLTIQKSIDMWAFGVLAYEVLQGERMYQEGADLEEVKRAIREGDVDRKLEQVTERAHKKLMVNLLKRDPLERWDTKRALLNGTFRSGRPAKKKPEETTTITATTT